MAGGKLPLLAPVAMVPAATVGGGALIDAAGPDGWSVDGVWRAGVLLVGPGGAAHWADAQSLDGGMLQPLDRWETKPELLFAGTGAGMMRPPADLAQAAALRGIRLEAMASRAAARTYNVLAGEGRLVAALLLPA